MPKSAADAIARTAKWCRIFRGNRRAARAHCCRHRHDAVLPNPAEYRAWCFAGSHRAMSGHGVATALLAKVESAPRERSVPPRFTQQNAWRRKAANCEDGNGWALRRLKLSRSTHLRLSTSKPKLGPLIERMRTKGRIPPMLGLSRSMKQMRPPYCKCILTRWAASAASCIGRFGDEGWPLSPRYSCVLLVGDRVKGCILAHRVAADVAAVDANILDPSVRGGWANVWLKLEATRGADSVRD